MRFYGLGGANANAEVKRAVSIEVSIPHTHYRSFIEGENERNLRRFALKLLLN